METQSVIIFSGLAIDVNMVKKLLQSHGIDSYAKTATPATTKTDGLSRDSTHT